VTHQYRSLHAATAALRGDGTGTWTCRAQKAQYCDQNVVVHNDGPMPLLTA